MDSILLDVILSGILLCVPESPLWSPERYDRADSKAGAAAKGGPGSDKGLLRIVEWLKEYGVPISFVPFTLHAGEAGTDDAAAQSRNDERTPCGTAAMSRFLSSSDRNVPLTGLPRRFGNTSRPE